MAHNEVSITILETSDVHGHIMPLHYAANKETPNGLARISSYIKEMRKLEPELLLIDNGDCIQGTPLTYHYAKFRDHLPNPVISVMNYLQYDCAVIGNHEFNYGMSIVSKAVSQSFFPWLSANILHKVTKESYFGYPYTVKEVNGVKIVIVGITTHYIPNWENPSHIKELAFEDALLSLKRWVQFIHETEEPDLLVVSYHGGFECDLQTAEPTEEQTGENQGCQILQEVAGIDLLLTGHQHRTVSQYVNNTYVLQPGFNGQHIGKAVIHLKKGTDSWTVEKIEGEVVSMEEQPPDEEVLDIVHFQELETQKWLDQPIGFIDGDMTIKDPLDVRINEHPMIEWINKVQMKAAGVSISNTSLMSNASKGLPVNVTMRDIVSNYIYPNTLTVLELSKEDIKKALEQSASYFMVNDENQIGVNPAFVSPKPQHYNYDMWEGIFYTIDAAKPIGERVIELEFEDEGPYHVVMNNYRAGGGGDFIMFKDKPVVKEILIDMAELLAEDLLEKETVKAVVNNNFKVINSEK
ncbi:bifunctional metallophosphatase/5'-nucleotidase [Jeotgalibacillus campisalis]|uniref:2',3'-cyclic-nucleotide 2'-phosphodiesterase n=1 Tax=Jeotgalibacillus campisalis TaxID=220754 RepID=A0A0C2S0F1_9BACL|nr:bifunctional UDP-sugar hydrolase/5'-nucleotidase [Jeotgalibacillus campisalis]KIL47509.1 2',3'-cyclic-nucleotide 2'-phosphodiesterase [Jeotgalibacillus campisalis]